MTGDSYNRRSVPWRAPQRLFLVSALGISFLLLAMVCFSGESGTEHVQPRLVPSPTTAPSIHEPFYPEWWGDGPIKQETAECREPGKCVQCHEDQARMDPSHAVPCVRCHAGDGGSEDEKKAHEGLIVDPGDLKHVDKTCGNCHPEEARRVRISAMALAPRMINQTRYAFGAQKNALPEHATIEAAGLKQVPHPSESSNLGDDLLRRSCLRCHLHTKGSTRWGEHRGLGCSACHVAYPNSSDGKPREHRLVRNSGMTACLKCHNSNHVGADYVGLFEKDFHRGFRSPFVQGRLPPRIYGAEQHRLSADVHFRAGMECMDCHMLDEIHGTGDPPNSTHSGVTISCESCHVHGNHQAVLKEQEGGMLLVRGTERKIPPWKPHTVPHRIEEHRQRLTCSACHASWSFQDYGLHLMLEERPDYWKWAPTGGQNDPQVQQLLDKHVGTFADVLPPQTGPLPYMSPDKWEPPFSRDWLTGELRPGAWFRGWTDRRWEDPPLGMDYRGKISVMRPMYQYVVSYVDANESLLLDRQIPTTGSGKPGLIVNPYAPHTTSRIGRNCHQCHGNPKTAGLGEGMMGIEKPGFMPLQQPEQKIPGHEFRWDALVDEQGTALQSSSRPSAGPLDSATLQRLMNPSRRHRVEWHRHLNGGSLRTFPNNR